MEGNRSLFFAYSRPESEDPLSQGDVITRTPEIDELLEEYHPFYTKEDYKYLILLTQSCDLEVRNGLCKSHYLTVAAVRPLHVALKREIGKFRRRTVERQSGVVSKAAYGEAKKFVQRLVNNNESEYFYLHDQPELNFPYKCVAFLRLSVSLKSEHYEKLRRGRLFSLTPVFKAKLGWLVGNMYSRVGTDDWVPRYKNRQEFDQFLDDLLDEFTQWVPQERIEAAVKSLKKDKIDPRGMDKGDLVDLIDNVDVPSRKEAVVEAVISVAGKDDFGLEADSLLKLRKRLENDPRFSKHFK